MSWPRSCRIRRTCASSRRSPVNSASRGRKWPTTSCTPGTRRPHPSRSRWPGWPNAGNSYPDRRSCWPDSARGCVTRRRSSRYPSRPVSKPAKNIRPKKEQNMTEQEILEGLAEIVEEIAGVPAADVTPGKSFVDDLDIDSLAMVEIAVAAQDKFGVEIPDDQLKDLATVQDVVNFVSKNTEA